MNPGTALDPELAVAYAEILGGGRDGVTLERLPDLRDRLKAAALDDDALSAGGAVEVSERAVPTADGAVSGLILRPAATEPIAGVFFLHSGGMIMGTNRTGIEIPLDWVLHCRCAVVSLEYRLAPEFPHPIPLDDCFRGLEWTSAHAAEIGFDPDRIIIAGVSGGGGLAGGVTLRARDEGAPALLGQMLMAPMLDDRNESGSSKESLGEGIWDRSSNLVAWDAMLGGRRGALDLGPDAAPSRALDFSGLPPTLIDVGSAEVFRDEAVDYADALWRSANRTELHVWPGAFHAFDTLVPESALARRAALTRRAWIERALGPCN